jgi:hypothetical protein
MLKRRWHTLDMDTTHYSDTTHGRFMYRRSTMKRYCELCDRWVPAKQTVCKACGAPTVKAAA